MKRAFRIQVFVAIASIIAVLGFVIAQETSGPFHVTEGPEYIVNEDLAPNEAIFMTRDIQQYLQIERLIKTEKYLARTKMITDPNNDKTRNPETDFIQLPGKGKVCGKVLARVYFPNQKDPKAIQVSELVMALNATFQYANIDLSAIGFPEPSGWGHPYSLGTNEISQKASTPKALFLAQDNSTENDTIKVLVLDTGYRDGKNSSVRNATAPGLLMDKMYSDYKTYEMKRRKPGQKLGNQDYFRAGMSEIRNGRSVVRVPVGQPYDDFAYFDMNKQFRPTGHGTGVVKIIEDLAGMKSEIHSMKICSATGFCTTISMLYGICSAIDQKADIVNLSVGTKVGGGSTSSLLFDAINDARANGVTVITASGNTYDPWITGTKNFPMFPAGFSNGPSNPDGLIAVAGVTNASPPMKTISSTCRPYTDFSAYGENVQTVYSNGGAWMDAAGTSFAAAQVSGVAAREIAANSILRNKPVEVEKALIEIAKKNQLLDKYCTHLGHGLIK
jgi:Subtilase family